MYGEHVIVTLDGVAYRAFVFCCPSTLDSEKKAAAFSRVKRWLNGDKTIEVTVCKN